MFPFALVLAIALLAIWLGYQFAMQTAWGRWKRATWQARRIVRKRARSLKTGAHIFAAGGFTPTGFAPLDMTPGGIRTEMNDALLVSLQMRPNVLAALAIGSFGGGGTGVGSAVQQLIHYWEEDRLNTRTFTEQTGGGMTVGQLTMLVNNAQAAQLAVYDVLADQAQTLTAAELIQITGMTVGATQTVLNVTRAFNGSTATTHAAAAVFEIVGTPRQDGTGLGADMSRSPAPKGNLIQTIRKDVVITGALASLAKHNMVPGMKNPLAYQLHQRFWEALVDWNRSVIKMTGTSASTQSNSQTLWGLLAWLGYNSTVANSTAVIRNAAGAPLSRKLISQVGIDLYLQGAEVPDVGIANPWVIDSLARLYEDQLRLSQTEMVRGFNVDTIRMSIGTKPVKLIPDGYMPDPTVVEPIIAFVDLDRLALIPFLDRGCFLLTSETTLDADVMSLIMAMTLEMRNTGTDFGQAHEILRNFVLI